MTTRKSYSYVVLRYIHDVVSQEFFNVGLILFAPEERRILGETTRETSRIKCAFKDFEASAFISTMSSVEKAIKVSQKQVESDVFLPEKSSMTKLVTEVLPRDGSSLQWSREGGGVCSDVDETFTRLFERYVTRHGSMRHEASSQTLRGSDRSRQKKDEDVWRLVNTKIRERELPITFTKKRVEGKSDSIEFERAYKNGRWHAYEPVSFDLATQDGIKDKARKWRGHLEAVSDADNEKDFCIHFLLGSPQNKELDDAFQSAIQILRDAPFDPTVCEDSRVDDFLQQMENDVLIHESS